MSVVYTHCVYTCLVSSVWTQCTLTCPARCVHCRAVPSVWTHSRSDNSIWLFSLRYWPSCSDGWCSVGSDISSLLSGFASPGNTAMVTGLYTWTQTSQNGKAKRLLVSAHVLSSWLKVLKAPRRNLWQQMTHSSHHIPVNIKLHRTTCMHRYMYLDQVYSCPALGGQGYFHALLNAKKRNVRNLMWIKQSNVMGTKTCIYKCLSIQFYTETHDTKWV